MGSGTSECVVRWVVAGAVCTLGACIDEGTESTSTPALQVTSHAVALSVTDVRFDVQAVDCETGDPTGPLMTRERALEEQTLPGNLQPLQGEPLDANSAHAFADLFLVVEPGCYDVATTPLEDGAPSDSCAAAFKRGVVVVEGRTTEILLLNQCEGQDAAAIDVISALNRAPKLEDVYFSQSKFSCGAPSEVCAVGSDPDGDPVDFDLTMAQGAPCVVSEGVQEDTNSMCWQVECSDWGRHDFTVSVFDMLNADGGLVRVEQWLSEQGYPNESRSSLEAFLYVNGKASYADQDGDGFGDEQSVEFYCGEDAPEDRVDNGEDCDDSEAASFPGNLEICDNIDNDCDGEVDEDGCDAPTPGMDIVVFNDLNLFTDRAMRDPSNQAMVRNLVDYETPGPRNDSATVWMDVGRDTQCVLGIYCGEGVMRGVENVIANAGYALDYVRSEEGTLVDIPADVKVIFLWLPKVAYTLEEINALKTFASEGGRVVFVGEHAGYYGPWIPIENDFLLNMGAVMTNIGQAVDCGYHVLPGSALRPHEVTDGMSQVTMACASVIVPGEQDYPLFYDSTNTQVLAGVAKIDTELSDGLTQSFTVIVQGGFDDVDPTSPDGE